MSQSQRKRKFIASDEANGSQNVNPPQKPRAPRKPKNLPNDEDDDTDNSDSDDLGFDDDGDGLTGDNANGNEKGPVDNEKRQKRLVKNRRAAQLFRKRQKQYIIDLEKQVNGLASQNAAYSAKVDLLSAENNLIKDQLGYLRSFISKAVQLSFPTDGRGNGGPPMQQMQQQQQQHPHSQQQQQQPPQQQQSQQPQIFKPTPTLPPFGGLIHPQNHNNHLPLPLHPPPHGHHLPSNNHNRHIPPPSDLLGGDLMHHQNSPFERH